MKRRKCVTRSTGRRVVELSEHRRALDSIQELQDRLVSARGAAWRRSLAALVAGLILGGAVPSLALLVAALTL